MNSKVEGLIFDLDDTIVRTEALNVELIEGYFRDVWNVQQDEDDRNLVLGHSWQEIYDALVEKYSLPITKWDVQDGILERKQVYLNENNLEIADGIELMMELPQRKVIVSCSGKSEIKMILDSVGLTKYFDEYFSVDEFLKGKPEPDGFLMALNYLALPPERTIVFEDSASGIEAAKRAGIRTVFIEEFAQKNCSLLADCCFSTFKSFYDKKNQLLG